MVKSESMKFYIYESLYLSNVNESREVLIL